MSIGFVVGRAGTGKTRHCLDAITQLLASDPLGAPIYWIVPRQVTFSVERMLLESFGPFSRCRIVSFDQLADEVLGEMGGSNTAAISARGRQMILGLLLRQLQNRLTFFGSSARRVGLTRELDRTFAELERTGAELPGMVETLETALSSDPTDTDTQTLLAKARDLSLLYAEYERFIGTDRLDPHRRLQRVLELMADCPTFRDATVFVDAFTDFSKHEREMIAGLAKTCESITVTMMIDPASAVLRSHHLLPDEMSLFHKIERNYRQLMVCLTEYGVTITQPIVLKTPRRFAAAPLATLERNLFAAKAPADKADVQGSIERIAAPDRKSEVDAVARRICDLTREGFRLRDCTVLVRDLTNYQSLLTTSFREHGLVFFIDVRRSAMHHPLLQWIRAVFAIARRDWPHEDVIALLKTGLAGLTLDQADAIENYVLHHGVAGTKAWEQTEPWAMQRGTMLVGDDQDLIDVETVEPSEIDQHRQTLLGKLRPFLDVVRHQPQLTFKQICSSLFKLLDAFHIRPVLATWISAARAVNQLELAGEHEQTWANLVELFDEMVDLLGEHEVSLDDFVQTLEAGLEQFDFALAPPTLDQVAVGEVDRSRASDAKVTFVLGLAEGLFPKAGSEPSVLTDSDRGLLRRRSIELDDDTARQLLDERLLGYLAFTRSSQRLILTRPSAEDSGRPLNASPFWLRLEQILPDLKSATSNAPCYAHDRSECIATPRQLVTGLMRWSRLQAATGATPDASWVTLYNAIAGSSSSPSPGIPGKGGVRVLTKSTTTTKALSAAKRLTDANSKSEDRTRASAEPSSQASPGVPGEEAEPSAGEGVSAAVSRIVSQAWPALSYTNGAVLSPAIAAQMFPSPLDATVSRIETFAACPFKHFAKYGLRLDAREVRHFTIADAGQAYHRIMESVVEGLLQTKAKWNDLTDDEARERIKETAAAVSKEIRNEVLLSTARSRYMLARIERTLSQVVASQRTLAGRQTLSPVRTNVSFGHDNDKLKPPLITTPAGKQVRLHGRIDRVDRTPDDQLAVVDYRSASATLKLQDVFHGLAMQLLAYMLVLRENQAARKQMTPIGAFYYRVTRSLTRDYPADAYEPGSDEFHLQSKPRGIFAAEALSEFDQQIGTGSSLAVSAFVTKGGELGMREKTDAANQDEIDALLDHVKSKIGELADDLMGGKIAVEPYRLGNATPCTRCDYRSVCRFEVGINRYHTLEPMKRTDVLARVTGNSGQEAQ